ncbi:hypothetical protein [Spirosoma agri]|uniref:Uncharacterized protein n=1 Tax=Spirosoma agri TaxID=1987381 RepID=A0A6M0IPN2_9BACT|nr:hypothetical protein [Spirosoma agri]NEU69877.1 hypothetical protein [Spirosoma agri]
MPFGVKRTLLVDDAERDMLAARRHYADSNGFTLLAERPDGLIALYWNELGVMVRLAIEPVSLDDSIVS